MRSPKFWRHIATSILIIIIFIIFSLPPATDLTEIKLALIQEGGGRILHFLANVRIYLGGDLTTRLAELVKQNLFSPPDPLLKPAVRAKIHPDRIPVIFVHGFDPQNTPDPGKRQFLKWANNETGFIPKVMREVADWESTYQALIFNYPTIKPVQDNAKVLKKQMDEVGFLKNEVLFIGYSLGGLIARYFDTFFTDYSVTALVMIGTPNRGSAVIDKITDIIEDAIQDSEDSPSADLLYQIAYYLYQSKGIQSLKSGSKFYRKLDRPKNYYYAIAGTDPYEGGWVTTLFAQYFEEPNDGVVSVESVKDGLPSDRPIEKCTCSHLTILQSDMVAAWTAKIINSGREKTLP